LPGGVAVLGTFYAPRLRIEVLRSVWIFECQSV
jgi:hypothetical protein